MMRLGVELEIQSRRDFAGGHQFGTVGSYERIKGKASFLIDPNDPAFAKIVDLGAARREADGAVCFSTPFCILKPKSMRRGNRRILYEVNNRGNKHLLRCFNDAPVNVDGSFANDPLSLRHAGNGFLMREGYTVVWSGWQGDLLPGDDRLTIDLPELEDGDAVTGLVRTELMVEDEGIFCLPLSGNDYTRVYPAASNQRSATLTCRENGTDERVEVPRSDWSFEAFDGQHWSLSQTHCRLRTGFRPGWIYELIYTGTRPLPMGLGFVGVAELVSFLLNNDEDLAGRANPLLEGRVRPERAYAWGCSQCARFLREFIYRGYNVDGQGRQIFNGLLLHVAGAGRVTLNYRFAQPGRHPRQHQDSLYASDEFPFAYPVTTDHLTGRTDGIMKRPETDPFIIHTQGSAEYWERRGSLVHTTTAGDDLADHEKSRCYLFTSAPHDASPYFETMDHHFMYPRNKLRTSCFLRSLLVALDEWATKGILPPESQVPRRSDGSGLSDSEVLASFPAIPEIELPVGANRLFVTDFGPDFDSGLFTVEPPVTDLSREYALLLPAVNADGLEIAGLCSPYVAAPLATFFGWNLRTHADGQQMLPGVMGGFIPFPRTDAERTKTQDPRSSIASRYPGDTDYTEAVRAAAASLVEKRMLLQEDAERFATAAAAANRALPGASAIAEPELSWDVAARGMHLAAERDRRDWLAAFQAPNHAAQ